MEGKKRSVSRRGIHTLALLFLTAGAVRAHAEASDTFRVRVGPSADESAHLIVGSITSKTTVVQPVKLTRFRGTGSLNVRISSQVIAGESSLWTVIFDKTNITLGPGGTTSTADVDRDGDVDDGDLAVFETCFSGEGIFYLRPPQCVAFDFDGDLDVDGADRAQFERERTPPQSVPLAGEIKVAVRAAATAPEGESVKVRITAFAPQTGESHFVNLNVTKTAHALELATTVTPQYVKARDHQIVFGGSALFVLDLFNTGVEEDTVQLSAEAASAGFAFDFFDAAGKTQSSFRLGAAGAKPGSLPRKVTFRLRVTTPVGWPRLSKQTVTVMAQGESGVRARLDLKLTRGAQLWTASDLQSPQGRRHLVRPGSKTTYLLTVTNLAATEKTYRLFPVMAIPAPGFRLQFSQTELTLAAGRQTEVIASLEAPQAAAPGTSSDWSIVFTDAPSLSQITSSNVVNVARVGAQVTPYRKIVQLAIDGLPPDYLSLNAEATGPGSDGDWLMPSIRSLMASSTSFTNARVLLPSFTDANHANALTGSLTGTSGASSIIYYYVGEDEDETTAYRNGDAEILRYGHAGEPVLSLFDVAKTENPGAWTAMVLGKNWVAPYFEKDVGGVDLVASGAKRPPYIAPPRSYVLGDPPSDSDAGLDPPPNSDSPEWGDFPGLYPEDRWVFEAAKRIIQNEDPDAIYVQPAHADDVQHLMGSAFDPSDWNDRGTATKWDDVNLVNPQATREEILDVMRELDLLVGDLLAFLAERGTLDDTYFVLHSDHGFVTQAPAAIDIRRLLEPAGFSLRDDYYAGGGGGFILIYDVDPSRAEEFEAVLERGPSITPGRAANAWVVLNREEMRSGVDSYTGRVWGVPGELYSEFFIDHGVVGSATPRWPSFFVFFDGPWQSATMLIQRGDDHTIPLFVGSHGGFDSQRIPLIVRGPGVPRGQTVADDVLVADIAPTLYFLQGWSVPAHLDGKVLPGISPPPSPQP